VALVSLPTSQVRVSTMLLLKTTENQNYVRQVSSNGITFIPNIVKIGPLLQKLRGGVCGCAHTHTDSIVISKPTFFSFKGKKVG